MQASTGVAGSWGRDAISHDEAMSFARRVPSTPAHRRAIADTLHRFPVACEVRGMFFDGLTKAIESVCGPDETRRLTRAAEVPAHVSAFTLHPHRDFYKLFFLAAPTLHPSEDLPDAMRRVAETFYPVFRESTLGRTMSLLMGREPSKVLTRLADAYNVSVPWNEHQPTPSGSHELLWRCRVEPTPFYPVIFDGIVRGTMRSHGVAEPRVELLSRHDDGDGQRLELRITWR